MECAYYFAFCRLCRAKTEDIRLQIAERIGLSVRYLASENTR
jgi:hypothetical protein